MGRCERESVVGGRKACSGSCGNMLARRLSAIGAVQQQRGCDEVLALPAGAAALVVLMKGSVVTMRWVQQRGPRVVGDARRSAGVAGDEIAM